MEEQKMNKELRAIRKAIYILAIMVIVSLALSLFVFLNSLSTQYKKLSELIESDSIIEYSELEQKNITFSENTYSENRLIEDSLKKRIDNIMDSLEQLEEKMTFMRSNSNISIDIIMGIADSIDFYKIETQRLQRKIEEYSLQSSTILQSEREYNNLLKEKLNSYEKQLMAMYAINVEILAFRDGFDQNNKLITTQDAKKVKEIMVHFKLSRDWVKSDQIRIELTKNDRTIFQINNVKTHNRIVSRTFKITTITKLASGSYNAVIYHTNKQFDIKDMEIGRGYLPLH